MRWIAVAVASLALSAVAADAPDPAIKIPVSITWDAKIPMRDGTKLSATIYRDPKQTKNPAIAMMTTPNQAELVDLPPFNFTARTLAKGSRVRVLLDAGPVFGWQRNSHSGGDLANEKLSAVRTARITISTGPDTGSAL